jgi:RHS repeat-associated protein
MFGDHLGSTTKVANADGSIHNQRRYRPWGEARFGATLPTTFAFTGQRQEDQLGGADGQYYYEARWYDPYLNRWLSSYMGTRALGMTNRPGRGIQQPDSMPLG